MGRALREGESFFGIDEVAKPRVVDGVYNGEFYRKGLKKIEDEEASLSPQELKEQRQAHTAKIERLALQRFYDAQGILPHDSKTTEEDRERDLPTQIEIVSLVGPALREVTREAEDTVIPFIKNEIPLATYARVLAGIDGELEKVRGAGNNGSSIRLGRETVEREIRRQGIPLETKKTDANRMGETKGAILIFPKPQTPVQQLTYR